MKEEFNLSKKRIFGKDISKPKYLEKDVKEFIKKETEAKDKFRDRCFSLHLSKEDIVLLNKFFEEFEQKREKLAGEKLR